MTAIRSRFDVWLWLMLPALLILALVFIAPLANLIALSFHQSTGPADVSPDVSLANYTDFVTDPFFLQILARTLFLGLVVVLCCLAIGYPVAYFLARTDSRWRGIALFLVVAPLLVSAIVRNIGWFPLLGESGLVNWVLRGLGLIRAPLQLVNNFTGVVIGLTHALLPFMILTLTNVIQRVEPDLEEAAANLGAAPFAAFWRVLLPLSLPGIVSGSLLTFTMAISAYTTPGDPRWGPAAGDGDLHRSAIPDRARLPRRGHRRRPAAAHRQRADPAGPAPADRRS